LKFVNKRDHNFFFHLYSNQDHGVINTKLKHKTKVFLKTAFPLLTKLLRSYYAPGFIYQVAKKSKRYNDFLYSYIKVKNFVYLQNAPTLYNVDILQKKIKIDFLKDYFLLPNKELTLRYSNTFSHIKYLGKRKKNPYRLIKKLLNPLPAWFIARKIIK